MIGFKTKAMQQQEQELTTRDGQMINEVAEQYMALAREHGKQQAMLLLMQTIDATLQEFNNWNNSSVTAKDRINKRCGDMIDKIYLKYYDNSLI